MTSVQTLSTPFWEGCARGELRIQRCAACGAHQFYPRPFCVGCGAGEPDWVRACGRAVVTTCTRVHVPLDESWAGEAPYWVALVRLEEGPTLMTNLVDTDEADIGMPVSVRFRVRADGRTVPVFAPEQEERA
jgi:uncharacterized OB-fold protein